MSNPILAIDGYKAGHIYQYPENTELVYSNLTPRSSKLANVPTDKIVFFGLQYFVKWFLIEEFGKNFFEKPRDEIVSGYKRRMDKYLGKDAVGTEHIAALHDLGYLPILIRALPEGTQVPMGVPVLTIENTHPDFFWLTNYLETILSASLWKATTTATTALAYRNLLERYAKLTGGNIDFVKWQAHDFSFRGLSCLQDAELTGAAHLTSFYGTDTIPAIDFLEKYYNADVDQQVVAGSVPATEHSVMCMGGKETEIETFRRLINDVYPAGIVSIVSDTWDFWKVVTEHVAALKEEILARDGKLVIRPDSGDPVKIICGDPEAEEGSPARKGAVECLWEVFGGTTNEKGFRTLDSHIGLIYGDSITFDRAEQILKGLAFKGLASDNIVFGIGSYTYNYVTRDTWGFAVKSTFGVINGEEVEIFKAPKTDSGSKFSAKGLLSVIRDRKGELQLVQGQQLSTCLLELVFIDGVLMRGQTLEGIRKLINEGDK